MSILSEASTPVPRSMPVMHEGSPSSHALRPPSE